MKFISSGGSPCFSFQTVLRAFEEEDREEDGRGSVTCSNVVATLTCAFFIRCLRAVASTVWYILTNIDSNIRKHIFVNFFLIG